MAKKREPEWVEKLKNLGKEHKHVEKKQSARSIGYVSSIIATLIIAYVFNNLLAWNVFPWLKDNFNVPLTVMNLSFAVNIIFTLFYLAFDPKWFRSMGQLLGNAISFAAVYTFYTIFPLDISSGASANAKLVLIIILIAIAIGTFVELIRFIYFFLRFLQGDQDGRN